MVVGCGKIVFRLYACHSLKEKRKIVKSMTNKLKNRFNLSIAETGANDNLNRIEVGFSMTGNDRRKINASLDKVFNMADALRLAQVIETDMEIISY